MRSPELPLLPLAMAAVPDGLRSMLTQEGVVWVEHVPGIPQARFVIYDSALPPFPKLIPGQQAIDLAELDGRGETDPWGALNALHTHRAVWQVGPHEVSEEVCRFDRRQLRSRVMAGLRQAVERAGGVWLCTAAVPFPYRSSFCLRLDHDDYVPADFTATLDALSGFDESASHFVCAAPFADQREATARLQGRDVGSHGYLHHTYQDLTSNLRNIGRGIEALAHWGLSPCGFVAPLGRYNPALEAALVELNIPYSSEFALACDDWPFQRAGGKLLQIPVHPISLGICLEALSAAGSHDEAAARGMADAWLAHCQRLIDARHQAGELTVVYCHPDGRLGRHPHVVRGLLEHAAATAGIWRTTMSQLARWWRARQSLRYRVYCQVDQYVVAVDEAPPGWPLAIEYWRGGHVAAMPLDRPLLRFSPAALAYQNRKLAQRFEPVRVDTARDLRHRLRRYLDWEHVTPTDQIEAGHFRGWLKRTLRRLRK